MGRHKPSLPTPTNNSEGDKSHSVIDRQVLPDPDNLPPGGGEEFIVASITVHVSLELGDPVVGVRLRDVAMVRADVEKARVHEDRHTLLREDHVGPYPDTGHDHRQVDAETKTGAVQRRPEVEFRLRVPTAIAPHRGAHSVAGCGRGRRQDHERHSFGKYFLAFSWGDTTGGCSSPNTGLVQSAHRSSG